MKRSFMVPCSLQLKTSLRYAISMLKDLNFDFYQNFLVKYIPRPQVRII
jgi:hypothetical protein